MPGSAPEITLHASCVALDGRALLIVGKSGSGKSALALSLMAMGADLVADDRTILRRDQSQVIAYAPDAIKGLIEARCVGLLQATPCALAQVVAIVDLDRTETQRLPTLRKSDLLGQSVTLFLKVEGAHFASALIQFLKAGRRSP
ncbi:HPr kinase/phosphorylase [Falsiphaeobacter marinintestinus]|uniref:HPr kinase/phosphorylase n=1 Tax=Falsiphaeobacter marinintestinus TaxID=1492905 RepID=UPI001FE83261|nr:HPr kinase/phosphatase C-terminal domain-containing protein [Phaeobacter marinintestinus]